ncbi:hypothetical protein LPW11_11235 [Geomonas sp. RF6]|uniref:hypothetical protein n=1 Tax=Geomonas sp. RF6 TaxID=2897342 RepID=UPI001E643E37|nr:hypothetical protein [Geomonas sp. RF6]UFS72746.1 hypothetical protein LPW11_11235 [Geomonas sp. RF6]
MRKLFRLCFVVVASLSVFGCAADHYNVPRETLEKKVKVVGVAPFMVDPQSDIRHPEKEVVSNLAKDANQKNEKELIARLRETGIYYSVRQVDGDPAELYTRLLAHRERRDDAGIIYNKYFYKKEEIRQLLSANGLDAILLVTVNGLTRPGKVFASNFLSYLETEYNYLALSAQLIDAEGNTLWEYPNFRQGSLSYEMLLPLQYPDFDEAAANLSDKVDVKFKTVAGIKAAFAQGKPSKFPNGGEFSTLYGRHFDEMISLLTPKKSIVERITKKETAKPAAEKQ